MENKRETIIRSENFVRKESDGKENNGKESIGKKSIGKKSIGKESIGKEYIGTGNSTIKNRGKKNPGCKKIIASAAAGVILLSCMLCACSLHKSMSGLSGKNTREEAVSPVKDPQEKNGSGGEEELPADSVFVFLQDSGFLRLKTDMDAGEVPVECKLRYEADAKLPDVRTSDAREITELYERLAQVRVGRKVSSGNTGISHHVTFRLRNDTYAACRFDGDRYIWKGTERFEVSGCEPLLSYMKLLEKNAVTRMEQKNKNSSRDNAGAGKSTADRAESDSTRDVSLAEEGAGGDTAAVSFTFNGPDEEASDDTVSKDKISEEKLSEGIVSNAGSGLESEGSDLKSEDSDLEADAEASDEVSAAGLSSADKLVLNPENVGKGSLNETRKASSDSGEQGKKPTAAKEKAGKENSGKEKSGKENSGKEKSGKENSGKEKSGKENSGKEKSGKENSGKQKSEKKTSGKAISEKTNSEKGQSEKDNSAKEKAGKEKTSGETQEHSAAPSGKPAAAVKESSGKKQAETKKETEVQEGKGSKEKLQGAEEKVTGLQADTDFKEELEELLEREEDEAGLPTDINNKAELPEASENGAELQAEKDFGQNSPDGTQEGTRIVAELLTGEDPEEDSMAGQETVAELLTGEALEEGLLEETAAGVELEEVEDQEKALLEEPATAAALQSGSEQEKDALEEAVFGTDSGREKESVTASAGDPAKTEMAGEPSSKDQEASISGEMAAHSTLPGREEDKGPYADAYAEILRAYSNLMKLDADSFFEKYDEMLLAESEASDDTGKGREESAAGSVGTTESKSSQNKVDYALLRDYYLNAIEGDELWYGIYDYNEDGIPELVIALGTKDYLSVREVYTFDGHEAVELFTGENRLGTRVLLYRLPDGLFMISASGGADSGGYTICGIADDRKGLDVLAEYFYDGHANGNMDHISETERLTAEEFNAKYRDRSVRADKDIALKKLTDSAAEDLTEDLN